VKKQPPELKAKVTIDGCIIDQVPSTKFLGVCIDECPTWSNHIKVISSKIAKHIGIIRKISHLLSNNTLINLYYTMINPYLIFGNIVWAANYDTRMRCLVLLQKKP